MSLVRVFAPASISNLGPGFDVLGLALSEPGDVAEAESADRPGVEIVEVTGDEGRLSRSPDENVAGVAATAALMAIRKRTQQRSAGGSSSAGVRLTLHKRMPLGSGLGSSGASSVAGAVAVNELFGRPLSMNELLACALEGERVASGSVHADNVAPTLFGGIVLIRSYEPLDILQIPVPQNLWVAVVHPHCLVRTAEARALVKEQRFTIDQAVVNLGNVAALVAAFYTGDIALAGRSVVDALVEPVRAHLIPGFHEVKAAALGAGALGCSIAGSGPSMFAFSDSVDAASGAAQAMQTAFDRAAGLESDRYVGRAGAPGARRID
jgi:homoserine kinase